MERNADLLAQLETDIIDRYLAERLDEAERERVEGWISANPLKGEKITMLKSVLRTMSSESANVDPQDAAQWADAILIEEESQAKKGPPSPPRSRVFPHVLGGMVGLTAAVAILVSGWGSVSQWMSNLTGGLQAPLTSVYSTGNGERATVTLPDGSTAVLSVASQIEVPSDYDRGNRVIRLRGEAMFTVTHQQGQPFTVLAGTSVTRVLGTTFVVRHYDTDTVALVAVRSGRVGIGDVVLNASQQVLVGSEGAARVSDAREGQFTFAEGRLTLNKMLLKDAVIELNRWYDADIRIADPDLDTRGIRGVFGSESIAELGDMLGFMFNIRVEQYGRVLILHSR